MLEDVLTAIMATAGLGTPSVVSPDREVWRRAEALGCVVVEEPEGAGHDLDAALRLAASRTGAGDGLLVVAADLPLAGPEALGRVALALGGAPVVVAPSADGSDQRARLARRTGRGGVRPRLRGGQRRQAPGRRRRRQMWDEPALRRRGQPPRPTWPACPAGWRRGSVTARRVRDLKLADSQAEQLGREQTRS